MILAGKSYGSGWFSCICWHFLFCLFYALNFVIIIVTAISVLSGLVVMMLTEIMKDQGSIPCCGTEYSWITNHRLFDTLLHLVSNVISELEIHEDMFSPWRGE